MYAYPVQMLEYVGRKVIAHHQPFTSLRLKSSNEILEIRLLTIMIVFIAFLIGISTIVTTAL